MSLLSFKGGARALAGLLIVSLTACATLPDNSHRIESHYFTNTGSTLVGRLFGNKKNMHPDPRHAVGRAERA